MDFEKPIFGVAISCWEAYGKQLSVKEGKILLTSDNPNIPVLSGFRKGNEISGSIKKVEKSQFNCFGSSRSQVQILSSRGF